MIYSKKSTGEVPFLPFLITFVNTSLWFGYGRLKQDPTIVLVNAIGVCLSFVYSLIYYYYSLQKQERISLLKQAKVARYKQDFVGKQLAGGLIFLGVIYGYVQLGDEDSSLLHLGFICSLFSILMFGSPLIGMGHVITTRDTSSMSFPLCLMNFLVSALWALFGFRVEDSFIIVPNLIGAVLSVVQLTLFAVYGFPKQEIKMEEFNYKDDQNFV